MTSSRLFFLFVISLLETNAQYDRDRQDSYDRQHDRQNPPYDQQYNRSNPPYDQYNRNNPPYDQYNRTNPPYDQYNRNNPPYDQYNRTNPPYDQYNRNNPPYDQYNRQNNPPYNQQYDRQGPPYGQQNPPYDRPYDRQNQYNQYNQPYNQSNPNTWQNHSQYGQQGPPYNDRDRQQYGNNPPYQQYGDNRDRYNNRNQDYNRTDQYGGNHDQYGGNRDQYGGNRDQYGANRDPYNRNQYQTGNRNDQYGGSGGSNYGSPLFDTNDNCCEEYCFSEDEQPYVYFATKTAYQIVYGKLPNQHNVPDCTPVQFWSINRHGARFPSARAIGKLRELEKVHMDILRNYDERQTYPSRGKLCPKDLDLFRRWRWNDTIDRDANALTSQGIEDLKLLARRYASKFGELFNKPYSDSVFNFQYTDTDRTHDSYQAFIEGLFKNDAYQVHANVFNDEKLIKPTKSCNAWTRQIEDNPQTLREFMRYKQRPEYQQMVRDIFRRLGFRYTPNEDLVDKMYDMCRYEKAWNLQRPSPWCVVFNKEQLKMIEYAEDLKYYYKSGYGNELNKKVGCPPLKDLYEKFDRTVNGDTSGHKVTVFFTHSVTLQTFLTAMGIARDNEPLTAENYFRQQNRQWRTAKIDPFSANLAATLYQCRSGERYRVMFFLNEVPVNYPDCSVGLCNWSTVKNKLESVAMNCNMDFCDQNNASGLQYNYIVYLLLSFSAIFYSFRF